MNTLFFFVAPGYDVDKAREVVARLCMFGFQCRADEEVCRTIGQDTLTAAAPDHCDAIVAVGGDGTMLSASHVAIHHDMPVFGINTGRLGFLHAFDYNDFLVCEREDILKLETTGRSLLEVSLTPDFSDRHLVVNDAVVQRMSRTKTAEFSVSYGGQTFTTVRADGIIVSTPTGSTAYSLSAGGPIVSPELDCTVITPVCSHSLLSQTLVVSRNTLVEVEVRQRAYNDASLSVDGRWDIPAPSGTKLYFRGSDRVLKLMTSCHRSFYDVLRRDFAERV